MGNIEIIETSMKKSRLINFDYKNLKGEEGNYWVRPVEIKDGTKGKLLIGFVMKVERKNAIELTEEEKREKEKKFKDKKFLPKFRINNMENLRMQAFWEKAIQRERGRN